MIKMEEKVFGFDESMQLFLKHLEQQHYSSETSSGYKKDLECFRRFMAKKMGEQDFPLDIVRKEELLAFMDDGRARGNSTSTIGRRISTMKSFYKFLFYELDFPEDVASRIRVPKEHVPLGNILTEGEVKRLLSAAQLLRPEYALLFSVLYYTGSHLTPVRLIERSHVNLEEGVIYFPEIKGGKELYLPLHEQLKEQFEHYFSIYLTDENPYVFPSKRCPNQPLSASDVRNKLRAAASHAGLNYSITPQTLRRCRAMHLTNRNVPQQAIASILGHSDLRSTMKYQRQVPGDLRGLLNML